MNTDNNDDLVLVKTLEHNRTNLKKSEYKNKEITDEHGRITALKHYKNRKLISVNSYKYDENGNEISHVFVQKGRPEYYQGFRQYYNENNQRIKMEFYSASKVNDSIHYFEYDSYGNRISEICRNLDGRLKYKFLRHIEYENNAKVITERCCKANGHLAWKAFYIHDSNDYVAEKLYIKNNLLICKIQYSYDNEGNKNITKKYLHKSYLNKVERRKYHKNRFSVMDVIVK